MITILVGNYNMIYKYGPGVVVVYMIYKSRASRLKSAVNNVDYVKECVAVSKSDCIAALSCFDLEKIYFVIAIQGFTRLRGLR